MKNQAFRFEKIYYKNVSKFNGSRKICTNATGNEDEYFSSISSQCIHL